MNARILAMLSVLVLASGCIIHNHDNNYYGSPGDVTFTWTFNGASCQQSGDVASVVIDIPGQVLQPNTFACLTNGYPGITLTNFDAGTYSYTVTAYDSNQTALYSSSGSFTVDGNTTVPVDLAPTANANSYAFLSWGFATPTRNAQNAPTCGNTTGGDIPAVRVTIDGAPSYYNCTDGNGSNAVETGYLATGQHTVEIAAVIPGSDPSGDYVFASTTSTLTTTAGQPTSQAYTMAWQVGGAAVDWAFYNGSTQYADCSQAGVDTLKVNFYEPNSQTYLYPTPNGDLFACPSGSNTVLYNSLPPGQFDVTIQADNSNGATVTPTVTYLNDYTTTQVTIQAGAFAATANAPTPATPLYLQP